MAKPISHISKQVSLRLSNELLEGVTKFGLEQNFIQDGRVNLSKAIATLVEIALYGSPQDSKASLPNVRKLEANVSVLHSSILQLTDRVAELEKKPLNLSLAS